MKTNAEIGALLDWTVWGQRAEFGKLTVQITFFLVRECVLQDFNTEKDLSDHGSNVRMQKTVLPKQSNYFPQSNFSLVVLNNQH